jgi:hypothetical protein
MLSPFSPFPQDKEGLHKLGAIKVQYTPRRAGFDTGSVHVGFVVDKVAVDRIFAEYVGFPLSGPFHRCPITRKRTKNNHYHLRRRVAQEALRLRCVRSVCCGALLRYIKKCSTGNANICCIIVKHHGAQG